MNRSEPSKHSSILGDAFLDAIRQVVREEIQAATGKLNGQQDRLLDLTQAKELLGIPKSRISQAVKSGDLICIRLGHYIRFRQLDLEEFILRHRENNA